MGVVMEASSAQKSAKRVFKKRINMYTGNVASYSDLINGPHQILQSRQENDLAAILGYMDS